MRHVTIVTILCILLFWTAGYADVNLLEDMNGTDWSEWSQTKKSSFASGFIMGACNLVQNNTQTLDDQYNSEKAWNVFFSYTYPDEKKPKKTFSRSEVALLLNYQLANRNIGLHQYSISGVTNDQLIDGLNVLYGDFKNKGIKIRDAIYIVKKQIKGASSEDIEAALQYLRADKDDSKRFYTDKDGKKKYVSFP